MMHPISVPAPEPPSPDDWGFVNDLRSRPAARLHWSREEMSAGAIDLRKGLHLSSGVDDATGLLTTAESDFVDFLTQTRLARTDGTPVITIVTGESNDDSHTLEVSSQRVVVRAGCIDGVRRGLYALQHAILGSDGPYLPCGTQTFEPWLKNRISRCFFGPIKRPPLNHDELMDDVDYYPDAYLSQLASEGINGLWLTIAFRDICTTSFTMPDPNAERRLAKLNRTIEKCRRYGIKLWAFCIEPVAFHADDPVLHRHPQLGGTRIGDHVLFCPGTASAQQYLQESTRSLFAAVPSLGGILNISHGERLTTCLSQDECVSDRALTCPRCGGEEKWRILHRSLSAMRDGMRAAAPQAELISWLYMPTPGPRPAWVFDLARNVPEGVILQYNFESNCLVQQLERPRIGGDYWLSQVGPSDDFARIASQARHEGTEVSAKIQVGCSHELATVPFVPVPGLLYRKYAQMRAAGCAHVMQCWYFGNYPGLMNQAAGMLAFETFDGSEDDFLLRLARPVWGSSADTVVQAWKKFADAYANYPLSNAFQYFGPVHNGVTWPLHLIPALRPLSATWIPGLPPSGDTIGECLRGFTLAEALTLCEKMSVQWREGFTCLERLRPRFQNNSERLQDIGLAEAIGIQLSSATNILRFYLLRHQLIVGIASLPRVVIAQMRSIVEAEITSSNRLRQLCASDSRLGFHSEAERHSYHPALLQWRVEQLQHLLRTEFTEVDAMIASGSPFPGVCVDRPIYRRGKGWVTCKRFRWRMDWEQDDLVIRAQCHQAAGGQSVIYVHLMDKAGICFPTSFMCNGDNTIPNVGWGDIRIDRQSPEAWNLQFTLPKATWSLDVAGRPAWFSFHYADISPDGTRFEETWPVVNGPLSGRLELSIFDPRHLAYLDDDI